MSFSDTTSYFFFFNDTATTEIYTLSLHDALPIYVLSPSYPTLAKYITHIQFMLGEPANDSPWIWIAPLAYAYHEERSEEHTSELQSLRHLVCRLLLEKKKHTHTLVGSSEIRHRRL